MDRPSLRVLIVDDEPAVRAGLVVWLGKRQFLTTTASDLRSAMTAIREHNPDVILLDVKLGPEDGLQLVELLRDSGTATPCVVLTAHAGPYDGFKAHELGVAALIEKPSSPDQIAATLRRVIENQPADACSKDLGCLSGIDPKSIYVASAVRLIHENFKTKGLSLEVIARRVGVSPGHLSKLFRHDIGCTVVTYVHRRRIVQAARLLTTTTLSVKAIADECGYHSSSELHRHFSRRNGQSPKDFRQQAGRSSI